MRRLTLSLFASTLVASSLLAQQKVPARPRLPEGTDTNDVRSYLDYGLARLRKNPGDAADAFYWALRIDPASTEAMQGRRVALLLDHPRLAEYVFNRGKLQNDAEIRGIDSLQYRAQMANPFIYRQYDHVLLDGAIRSIAKDASSDGDISAFDAERIIESAFRDVGSSVKAWQAYGDGRLPAALDLYAKALRERDGYLYHVDRGQIFFLQTKFDSALAELTTALTEMRKRDAKSTVWYYQSKAMLEHSIGIIHEARGDKAAAREAYGRALTEDLSFYPSHTRLGGVALAQGDTATALSELALAVQLKGDDPVLRYQYGFLVASAGKLDDASAQLAKAIALEPYYATPYYFLARVHDAKGESAAAMARYREFLARASAQDANVDWTMQRVAQLQTLVKK